MGNFIGLDALLSHFQVKGGFPPKLLLPKNDYDWMIQTKYPQEGASWTYKFKVEPTATAGP